MDEMCLKGLINEGNNMCFVNVICQSLWNLVNVKNYLFNNSIHSHSTPLLSERKTKILEMIDKLSRESVDNSIEINKNESENISENELQKNCLQCVLSKFFSNYFNSNLKFLDASEIRAFLINLNNSIQKFSKNGMSCSTETLEEMILYFHRSYLYFNYIKYKGIFGQKVQDYIDTISCNDKCLTHCIFTTEYVEVVYCENCPDNELFKNNKESFSINYIYLSDLEQKKSKNLKSFIKSNYKLSPKIKQIRCLNCDNKKEYNLKIKKCLIRPSKVITISLVSSLNAKNDLVFDKIDKKIFLSDLYDKMDIQFYKKMLILKGFICFRNKHYIYAGYVNKSWVIVNDENVLNFNNWDNLKEMLIKNLWFPTLLFYEDIDFTDEVIGNSDLMRNNIIQKNSDDNSLNSKEMLNLEVNDNKLNENNKAKDSKRRINDKKRKSIEEGENVSKKEECMRCKFF